MAPWPHCGPCQVAAKVSVMKQVLARPGGVAVEGFKQIVVDVWGLPSFFTGPLFQRSL